jgi:cytoskeletal protein RodZ
MSDPIEMLPTEETPIVRKSSISIREARQRVGMTLEQLSRRTRITSRIITALENNDREGLPAPVFVRGYLRAIATELNADVSPWLDPWKESSSNALPVAREPQSKTDSPWWQKRVFGENLQVPVRIGHVLSVVLAILAFFLLYFAIEGSNPDLNDSVHKDSRSLIETLDTRPIQGR